MSRYYNYVAGRTSIDLKSGGRAVVSIEFRKHSALIISRCSFLQNLIQEILFTTHGANFFDASAMARGNPSPNARMDFLCSTHYGQNDIILSEVFSYSQKIFRDIYGLRNILAHEIWMSCDDYAFKTLFSKIEEEERKLKIAGRIKFDRDSKSIDAYNAIVRYIGKIKVIGVDDLKRAIEDINLCEWMLMTVNQVLGEDDPQKRDDLRRSFLVFGGTSHLFSESQKGLTKVEVLTSKKSSIFR